jgi:hypothetical protein
MQVRTSATIQASSAAAAAVAASLAKAQAALASSRGGVQAMTIAGLPGQINVSMGPLLEQLEGGWAAVITR